MRPVLITWEVAGSRVSVASYDLALLLASGTVLALGWYLAVRRGLAGRPVFLVLLVAGLATIVGARAVHVLSGGLFDAGFAARLTDPHGRGFALSGGLSAALLAGWVTARRWGINPWALADSLTLPLALGIAVLRVGCFLQGCCFGLPTTVSWGVVFPWGSPPHLYQLAQGINPLSPGPLPVHPTQLYELGAALLTAVLAATLLRRRVADGWVALPCAFVFLVLRAGILEWRAIDGGSWWVTMLLASILVVAQCLRSLGDRCPGSHPPRTSATRTFTSG